LDDDALLRYSRHILLNEIGVEAQSRLNAARVLVVGLGGLGSSAAIFLAASGVGELHLADGDAVDLSNLQRQVIHSEASLGESKVKSAAARIAALNSLVKVHTYEAFAEPAWLDAKLSQVDCVLDCTDRFATRQMINAACVRAKKPLVVGAALGFDGQLVSFDLRRAEAPCYACLFPPETAPAEQLCATFGVFAPLVGMVGSMQAAQALKLLGEFGSVESGALTLIDAQAMRFSRFAPVAKRSRCVCESSP
jgi:molybdopterin-synthase adenylyltransferase